VPPHNVEETLGERGSATIRSGIKSCGLWPCVVFDFVWALGSRKSTNRTNYLFYTGVVTDTAAESNQNGGEDRPFYDHTLRNWSCKGIFSGGCAMATDRQSCLLLLSPCVVPIVHGPSRSLTTPQETCKTGEAGALGRVGGRRPQPKGGRRA
jgi:hypothetical protein